MDTMHFIAEASSSDNSKRTWGRDTGTETTEQKSYGYRGDQLGIECRCRYWYDGSASGGWGHIIRMKDSDIAETMAQRQYEQVTNGFIGYSQGTAYAYVQNRISAFRKMAISQEGALKNDKTYQEWVDSGFATSYVDYSKMTDPREFSVYDCDVEANSDCSSTTLQSFMMATGLWHHYGTDTNGVKVYWYSAQPSSYFCKDSGGWAVMKSWEYILSGQESNPVKYPYTLSNIPCDYVDYEDRPLEEFYDLSNFTEQQLADMKSYLFKQGELKVRLWHIGYKVGGDRSKTFNAIGKCYFYPETSSSGYTGSNNYGLVDARGYYMRANLYSYGFGKQHKSAIFDDGSNVEVSIDGEDIPEGELDLTTSHVFAEKATVYFNTVNGVRTPTYILKEGSGEDITTDETANFSHYNFWYEPPMEHYIAAADKTSLLKANYDKNTGTIIGYKDSDGNQPFYCTLYCKHWNRNPKIDGTDIDGTYWLRYNGYPATYKNFSTLDAFYADLIEKDTNRIASMSDGWTEAGGYDTSDGKGSLGDDQLNLTINLGNGKFEKRSTVYSKTTSGEKIQKATLKDKGNNAVNIYYVSGDLSYIWYENGKDYSTNTSDLALVFPNIGVTKATVNTTQKTVRIKSGTPMTSESGETVTLDGDTDFDFPEDFPDSNPYYKITVVTTGTLFKEWVMENDGVVTRYIQDWEATTGTEEDDDITVSSSLYYETWYEWSNLIESEEKKVIEIENTNGTTSLTSAVELVYTEADSYGWRERRNSPIDMSTTKSDDGSVSESTTGNAIVNSKLPVISYPNNLKRGDILMTRRGTEGLISGGHMAMWI